jgi:hypothetical protein
LLEEEKKALDRREGGKEEIKVGEQMKFETRFK